MLQTESCLLWILYYLSYMFNNNLSPDSYLLDIFISIINKVYLD